MNRNRLFIVKLTCWVGVGADALWALGLFFPSIFTLLAGGPDFNPELQVRLIMGIGGSLMLGWTFLLIWVVQNPVERRGVLLLTAFPVIIGMFMVALIGAMNGNTSNIWILIKTSILFVAMIYSYFLTGNIKKHKRSIAPDT